MPKYLIILLICSFYAESRAQEARFPNLKDIVIEESDVLSKSYDEVCSELDQYFGSSKGKEYLATNPQYNDYIRYHRWKHYWRDRLTETGEFTTLDQEQNLIDLKKRFSQQSAIEDRSLDNWVSIGPNKRSGGFWGMGRVMAIAFHPTSVNTFYVGAAKGGIWKTTDGGSTYQSLGDDLPYNSVSNILVNNNNPNIIHVVLGDRISAYDYSLGVWRSTNGGESWTPTSLEFSLSEQVVIMDMDASASNPNVIVVATEKGVYRSSDGSNFSIVTAGLPGGFHDFFFPRQVLFSDQNPNLVFLSIWDKSSESSGIWKSVNAGQSWTKTKGVDQEDVIINMALSSLDNERIIAKFNYKNFDRLYVSENLGDTWIDFLMENEVDGDLLYISPTEENTFYTGYFHVWRSFNRGAVFNKIAAWDVNFVHVDQWVIEHNPLNNKMYWGNDGGVYSYIEQTETWTELNDGLVITQMYDASVAQDDSGRILFGSQDNGGAFLKDGQWINTNGGDAVTNSISTTNSSKFLTAFPLGLELHRTSNAWNSSQRVDDHIPNYRNNADWLSPNCINPKNDNHLLVATTDVYSSLNFGDQWEVRSSVVSGNIPIRKIEIAQDGITSYATSENNLYRSEDDFLTWNTFAAPGNISDFEVHPENPSTIWITVSGFSNNKKVYKSENGGANWINISSNLENIPCLSIAFDKQSEQLFVGTELGVFRTFTQAAEWTLMTNGLPFTQVNDLEIHESKRLLYAATYGRGMYEYEIESEIVSTSDVKNEDKFCDLFDLKMVNKNLVLENISDFSQQQLMTIDGKIIYSKKLENGVNISINKENLLSGVYLVVLRNKNKVCTQRIFIP